jgi:type IV fimbrial biogenesis protein FimT
MAAADPRLPAGLTLIELMVVVAVMAILVLLAGPSVRDMVAVQRVQGINAELVTDLQFARGEASRRNRDVHMRFGAAGDNCYVLYIDLVAGNCDCTRTPGVNVCNGGIEEIKTVKVPPAAGVSLSASSATGPIIVFDKRAGTSLPAEFTVSVSSEVHGQLRTQVNPAGRPSVCSPDGSVKQVPPC